VTVREPPAHLLYDVRIGLPGDPGVATVEDLGKRLLAKASESLRRRCEGLRIGIASSTSAEVTARVNDWNTAAAAMRLATLVIVRAGEGWDHRAMTVHAVPAVPLSSCCSAVTRVEGDVTQFWVCLGCSRACDVMPVSA
jgi:hypothetical protein